MGVLNVTPDSFSDGGDFFDTQNALSHARQMVSDGAAIIDVGGESSRPGAKEVSVEEEWDRIKDVVATLAQEGICVSVDTRHAQVAAWALEAGASIINDISGFCDPVMIDAVKHSDCGLVVMHMQGEPSSMHENPQYVDVVREVYDFLREQALNLELAGVARDRICIDPGPGFGKTSSHTIELIRNLHEFCHLGYPVMIAVSRKGFLQRAYKIESDDPKDRDVASAAEALLACELGANVVRTHNVSLTVETLKDLRPYVFLGLGSNIALVGADEETDEGKIAQINMAIGKLCQLPDSQIIDVAPFYKSKAAYVEDQDDFINTVVLLRTGIPPKELLDYLHMIENSLGRVRGQEKGPRTIDIDILDYQMYAAQSDELSLPHAGVCERDFVVKPLTDIWPDHILADGTRVNSVSEDKRFGKATRY